jgi:putative Mg2+ transporter-C (MgtC) family protein
MSELDTEILWPVVGCVIAGALIGLERQYRGAPAGFRTHILLALSSGLLMLAAVHQIRWLTDTPVEIIRIDPVRMAHGILTGIGFLGAGVIFREGFDVKGLTTAASLWITSALGILFGVGFYALAIGGTIATVVVLAAVSLTETLLPQKTRIDIQARYLRTTGMTEEHFRTLLAAHGLRPITVRCSIDEDAATFDATCRLRRRPEPDALFAAMAANPQVRAFSIAPHG